MLELSPRGGLQGVRQKYACPEKSTSMDIDIGIKHQQQRTTQDLTKPNRFDISMPYKRLQEPKLSDTNDTNYHDPLFHGLI